MDARSAIEEARRLKADAEKEITRAVLLALRNLEKQTGLSATAVEVDMGDVTSVHDCDQRYTVLGCRIDLGRI